MIYLVGSGLMACPSRGIETTALTTSRGVTGEPISLAMWFDSTHQDRAE